MPCQINEERTRKEMIDPSLKKSAGICTVYGYRDEVPSCGTCW